MCEVVKQFYGSLSQSKRIKSNPKAAIGKVAKQIFMTISAMARFSSYLNLMIIPDYQMLPKRQQTCKELG
jgi:hypothetical protein